jgi:hypothetical protein
MVNGELRIVKLWMVVIVAGKRPFPAQFQNFLTLGAKRGDVTNISRADDGRDYLFRAVFIYNVGRELAFLRRRGRKAAGALCGKRGGEP